MDKSTNVHQKVAATFVNTYYNALAEGKIADVQKMYVPTAKVSHWNADGVTNALAFYTKGAAFEVTSFEAVLIDNSRVKIIMKGSITIEGEKKKEFMHDIELVHHDTSASQLSFGISSDFLRAHVPPPPKMKFDDWAADTPQLNANEGSDVVPDIELATAKEPTPKPTPKVVPAPSPAAPAPVEEKKVEEKKEAVVEEKKEAAAPAASGWASIVRSDKAVAKPVLKVVDPTKKVAPVVEKKETEEKKEKKTKKEDEEAAAPKERRSNKAAGTIFYDVFVKGFPDSITESAVPTALGLKVAVSNTKIDTKEDKNGVKRVFVYIKLSAEDLAKQNVTREEAIATIVANNKNTKFGTSRLSVEEVKERFLADGTKVNKK